MAPTIKCKSKMSSRGEQRNRKPTIVLEMDDKIQTFCLSAAKLSTVLSVQRLKKKRDFPLNLKSHVFFAQGKTAAVKASKFTHPEIEWK